MTKNRLFAKFLSLLDAHGTNLEKGAVAIRNTPRLLHMLRLYRQNAAHGSLGFSWIHFSPYLHDFDQEAGTASRHYFHQDIWAARKNYAARPAVHVDIGSRIGGFVAHFLTFMPVTVIDIRPLQSTVTGLTFMHADATD